MGPSPEGPGPRGSLCSKQDAEKLDWSHGFTRMDTDKLFDSIRVHPCPSVAGPFSAALNSSYCRSLRIACGAELACAMAATEACSSTWALVRLAAWRGDIRVADLRIRRSESW